MNSGGLPTYYGTQKIQIIKDRHCGDLQPIRDSIRSSYASGNISEWMRLSVLLTDAMAMRERSQREAA